jgi:hypothetical protein
VSYGALDGFGETYALVAKALEAPTERLARLNESAIAQVSDALGISRPRVVRASELDADGAGSDLLAGLVAAAGGTVYLSGGGAAGYHDGRPFAERGIEVRYQDFRHPEYPQHSPEPVHGLSVVDAMMSLGASGVRHLLRLNGAPL